MVLCTSCANLDFEHIRQFDIVAAVQVFLRGLGFFFVISQPMCTQAEALGVPWLTTVSKWYADGAVTALGGA